MHSKKRLWIHKYPRSRKGKLSKGKRKATRCSEDKPLQSQIKLAPPLARGNQELFMDKNGFYLREKSCVILHLCNYENRS